MWFVKTVLGWFTGGTLDRVLDTVDHRVDNATERERIRADVTRTYATAQAALLANRTWWFQLFFVVPLGVWFSAVVADSIFHFPFDIAALPAPLDEWGGWIITALFLVDGSKSVLAGLRR